jgi:hypothetical protein
MTVGAREHRFATRTGRTLRECQAIRANASRRRRQMAPLFGVCALATLTDHRQHGLAQASAGESVGSAAGAAEMPTQGGRAVGIDFPFRDNERTRARAEESSHHARNASAPGFPPKHGHSGLRAQAR